MSIGLKHYLVLSAFVFACGLLTILLKRNAIGILIGVELVLNAATINLVALNKYWHAGPAAAGTVAAAGRPLLDGQVFALFVIVIAAAEAAVALAIFLNFYNNFASIDVERGKDLKG
ncbi:MAG: NADH-ubiquinone oxidoreductase chain K [uncultured Phycisphaerae bacterium]|uniref:NADH-quinone oxidoreductase subunit K n=1 Tax=uncultured Phycisphaerae bacterium TaxID=904963 RepID=A0A6J4NA07_9BACT|nr:MAG: NADH-ubiquinone oxidoreductase chain K [uncultured Phycisphaerae bacterium]